MIDQEPIFETKNTRVCIIKLTANTEAPWHYHSEVTEDCFCLEGGLTVQTIGPDQILSLTPGKRCTIVPGLRHRVINCTSEDAEYLLVQGIGKYDFLESCL